MPIQKPYSGCFTKQIFLQGMTLREIERRLGFHAGRLSKGATFVVATQLPDVDAFDLAGYTQVAGHHTKAQYGDINNPRGTHELTAYRIKKQNAINEWRLSGSDRLVKVLPTLEHSMGMADDDQYPPGSGVPQWIVKRDKKILCKEIATVTDYPNGKFIPDEGFTPVNYGR